MKPRVTTVIVLCAAWCDTCREFRSAFERLANARRDAVFVWLDVEDDSALVGDVEVEDFPTLAMFREDVAVFFGATSPQGSVVARLLDALTQGATVAVAVPDAVAALPRVLDAHKGKEGVEQIERDNREHDDQDLGRQRS